jgi:type IV secretory pathway VirB2 component (pilin)
MLGMSVIAVGYDTIAAAGDHACTLHWIATTVIFVKASCCCWTPASSSISVYS